MLGIDLEVEMEDTDRLSFVYQGWDGYQLSLAKAIETLTPEQLAFRACPEMLSVGELAWHIADGRVFWFRRMGVPGGDELMQEIEDRQTSQGDVMEASLIVAWLEKTWEFVNETLSRWKTSDLTETYRQAYQGKVYAVTRQWTIWRILSHDAHHGGQLSELLAMQGIFPLELTQLGGHLTEPEVVEG